MKHVGSCNAPAQSLMNESFRDCIGHDVVVFLDDLLVFSEDEHKYLEHLEHSFIRPRLRELYVGTFKCSFMYEVTDF